MQRHYDTLRNEVTLNHVDISSFVCSRMNWKDAFTAGKSADLAGYDDWRIPTIKKLYSLIQISGRDIVLLHI